MVYYSALHWAKKAEKSAEHVEEIKKELDMSGLDLTTYAKDAKVVHNTGDETIDGVKEFKQGIKGSLQNYYAHNGTTNDKPWKKLMEITLSGAYNTVNIPFIMTHNSSTKYGYALGTINLRNENTAGTLNTSATGIHFNVLPVWYNTCDYKILYKNNYPESGKILIEFWVKVTYAYSGVCFTILDEMASGVTKLGRSIITWYNNTEQYAELPTGYEQIDYTVDILYTGTPSAGANDKSVATTEWCYDHTKSTNLVHKTGDETIEGVKTFTNVPYINTGGFREIANIDKGTKPSSTVYGFSNTLYDKNGTQQANKLGQNYITIDTSGGVSNSIEVFKPVSGSSESVRIGVGYDSNGNIYTTAPIPTDTTTTSGRQIATTGWCNDATKSTNIVHKTGNETIKDKKTFESSAGNLYVKFSGFDSAVNPSSARYNCAAMCYDKNDVNTGNFRNLYLTNGDIITDMQVCRKVNDVMRYGSLQIGMKTDGSTYTSAPTPSIYSNSTDIATTEWVNTTLTTAISEFVKGGSNYIKIPVSGKTNPLIIQWGYLAASAGYNTITFPTAFSGNDYTLSLLNNGPSGTGYVSYKYHTTTSTDAEIVSSTAGSCRWMAVGY